MLITIIQLMEHLVVIQSLQQLHLLVVVLVQVIAVMLLVEPVVLAAVAELIQVEVFLHQRKDLLVEPDKVEALIAEAAEAELVAPEQAEPLALTVETVYLLASQELR
jgi:hypothetical protein